MTTPRRLATRLSAVLATTLVVIATGQLATATPALADVPVGFGDPIDPVNPLHAFLVVAGIPLALGALIFALVYVPSIVRGERVAPPGTPAGPDQWLGGPRRGTAELAAPDGEDSKAGGARGTW